MYEVKDHWLYKDGEMVSVKPSPNYGGVITPEMVVIHYTGDNGTGGLQWLTSKGSNVSAHLWIAKTGVIWQVLPFNIRAWHAGVSEYDGRSDCNSWSIGIENQGIGDSWPEAQIQANIGVLVALHKAYQINYVVGHSDVAPGRKVDPGPLYPWERIYAGLADAGIKYD